MIANIARLTRSSFAEICCIAIGFATVAGCNGSAIGTTVAPAGSAAATGSNSIGGHRSGDEPVCVSDGDCGSLATSPCAIAVCEQTAHRCTVVNKPDFAACAVAGDLCASEAACLAGACVAIRQKSCDDANPCTKDLCLPAQGCVNSPQSLVSCSDGNPCTLGDHCVVGTCTPKVNVCACNNGDDCQAFANKDKCAGTLQCSQGVCVSDPLQKVDCNDKNPCTKDSCDAETGQCLHNALKDGAVCDDNDICTLGERCAAGVCTGIGALGCGINPSGCPTICDKKLGCVADPKGGTCDDGNACSSGDHCQSGACVGAASCECKQNSDCELNSKVPACQGVAVCLAGKCAVDANLAVPCMQTDATCVEIACTAKGCEKVQALSKTPCKANEFCTWGDTCDAKGICVAGKDLDCDDDDACTVDFCSPKMGCQHGPGNDGQVCNDGNPCTKQDLCVQTTCVGGGDSCDDGDGCTLDLCDPTAKNACIHTKLAEGAPCEDSDPCTTGGACLGSKCLSAQVQDCDDGNPCTTDICADEGGCAHNPAQSKDIVPCDDANPCTSGDQCSTGECKGIPGACQCEKNSDCAKSEDGNFCNGTLVCSDHACVLDPGTVVTCAASLNPCIAISCLANSGVCVELSLIATETGAVACSDGDACTVGDVCAPGGVCQAGKPQVCGDGNDCTADSCDPASGCVYTAFAVGAAIPCDDGNSCTFGDTCADGGCQPGNDACECKINSDCAIFDDGNACNGGLVCNKGACISDGKTVTCDTAGNSACASTQCDPSSGQCVKFAEVDGKSCDIANSCASGGQCQSGTCVGAVVSNCDDKNACTSDKCTPTGCIHTISLGASCSDDNTCTSGEVCGVDGTCGGGNNVCVCKVDKDCPDDGDLCNGIFVCNGGTCQPKQGSVVVCDATGNTTCQTNACVPVSGICQMKQAAGGTICSDGDACTVGDSCQNGACKSSGVIACVDDNVCTDDGCNPANGCYHNANVKSCDDGNPCTVGDKCANSKCVAGTGACDCTTDLDCKAKDDNNLCNGILTCQTGKCALDVKSIVTCDAGKNTACALNICDPASGICALTPVPSGTQCDDANICTKQDQCTTGVCGGTPIVCDDSNVCTDDSCSPVKGCSLVPNNKACDDGNKCTSGDTCVAGSCTAGKNICGICNIDSDCVDDGNLCNGTLMCQGGNCVPKPNSTVICAATDTCNDNICQPNSGLCVKTAKAQGAPCDDGTVCTGSSTCLGGACVGTNPVDCDDKNVCTKDSCNANVGCTHGPTFFACDDGNLCTKGDICNANGQCVSGVNQCACLTDADCKVKDDADLCNGVLTCQGNQCLTKPGSVVTCAVSTDICSPNVCEAASGICKATSLNSGACNDSNACTQGDSCQLGKCVGASIGCDDSNVCTTDTCDASGGCLHKNTNNIACDDGNACTANDVCTDGACTSGANTCQCKITADCAKSEDGNLCNGTLICQGNQCVVDAKTVITCAPSAGGCAVNACDAKSGLCVASAQIDGTPCGGAALCGGSGACKAGVCTGTNGCADDGNVCTTAACDGKGNCANNPIVGACDDANNCTVNDQCSGGKCVSGANQCNCKINSDCVKFDDGNLCNGIYKCQAGQCQPDPNSAITCPPAASACTISACDPTQGQCVTKDAPNGTACDDNNVCTAPGQCFQGACLVKQIACNDNNPCTNDTCDAVKGCSFANIANFPPTTCDDGDTCTPISICQGGKCAGVFNNCFCQNDSQCQDDNNLCNGSPSCQGGTCKTKPGTVVTCDAAANSDCIKNTCVPLTGTCQKLPAPAGTNCDDKNLCTGGDICSGGICIGVPLDCKDGIDCTLDQCDSKLGCIKVPNNAACDDNNGCTNDICDTVGGCIHQGATSGPCNDQDPCTTGETCQIGPNGAKCMGGSAVVCDDKNPCTKDSCSQLTGCVFTPVNGSACDDSNPCTQSDVCGNNGCAGVALNCDDNNVCTADSCGAKLGCVHDPSAGNCDDGNVCTTGDLCNVGACVGGKALNCDDGNACTTDACDSKTGCSHVSADGASCDDGFSCTIKDVCLGGKCNGTPFCDDGNACTNDGCGVGGKCVSTPAVGLACNDNDACTSADACQANATCLGKSAVNCDDGNVCTLDSCDKVSGKCSNTPSAGPCNDGNACTNDACNAKTGACVGTANPGAACNDADACTGPDVCSAAAVCAGVAISCDDKNACTADSCDKAAGCAHSIIPGYSENFESGSTGTLALQSLNQQIKWTIDQLQSKSAPNSLYIGRVLPNGLHTYNAGPTSASATIPGIVIPAGVTTAIFTMDLNYDRDLTEANNCQGFIDQFNVQVNGQNVSQTCKNTGGWTSIAVDLAGQIGTNVGVGLTFISNFNKNNGQGAWVDNLSISWTCK